jgi:predicted acetylornithine/succinylornithine family transaminase
MKMEEIFKSYEDFVVPSYTKIPLIFVKGKGSFLWDVQGKKYLDFFPGFGAGNLGQCHPKVLCAVRDQIDKLVFVPNTYYNVPQAKLAKELNYWAKNDFKAFFCNSGAEANEAAIKLSRKFGQGRFEMITFENSFHGRTMAALSATGQTKYQQGFSPLVEGFKVVKFNDLAAVNAAVSDKTVAVMLELVQGEGGINIANKDFILELRKLCNEKKLLLIIDEVQTGVGRTGKMFAWQNYGIVPDIFTLAKSLAGGLPIGVMMARKDLADLFTPGTHASTFGGGPVICKAALAVLTAVADEKLLTKANKAGAYLLDELMKLQEKYPLIKDVRGLGLMCGLELDREGKPIVEACLKLGLLINCTHGAVLRIMPALGVSKKEIDKAVTILERVLKEVK